MFAGSVIGIFLLCMAIEGVRRLGREYDRRLVAVAKVCSSAEIELVHKYNKMMRRVKRLRTLSKDFSMTDLLRLRLGKMGMGMGDLVQKV